MPWVLSVGVDEHEEEGVERNDNKVHVVQHQEYSGAVEGVDDQ